MNIVVLPCAGGSSFNYRKFKNKSKDVIIYEYPGHWSKIDKEFDKNMEEMVKNFVDEIVPKLVGNDLIILGHSMGALVGFESIEHFQSKGINVKKIYIAACASPDILTRLFGQYSSDLDVMAVIKKLRQVPDRILYSEFFTENLLPAIKNDFRLIKELKGRYNEIKKCNVPIVCLGGENDSAIHYDDIMAWREYTDCEIAFLEFEGNHFFVCEDNNIDIILGIINNECASK